MDGPLDVICLPAGSESGVTATIHCQVESERVHGGLVMVTEMEVVIVFVFVL